MKIKYLIALTIYFISNNVYALDQTGAPKNNSMIYLGIGHITNSFDKTSDSFVLYDYLSKKMAGFKNVKIVYMDYPADVDYGINGNTKSEYSVDRTDESLNYTYKNTVGLKFWVHGKKIKTADFQCTGNYSANDFAPSSTFRLNSLVKCFDDAYNQLKSEMLVRGAINE